MFKRRRITNKLSKALKVLPHANSVFRTGRERYPVLAKVCLNDVDERVQTNQSLSLSVNVCVCVCMCGYNFEQCSFIKLSSP